MKRHWVRLQLGFEGPKDVKLEILSRRAALSGNTLRRFVTLAPSINVMTYLITYFSSYLLFLLILDNVV